ncbi:MAG TPA: hypothetical protein VLA35_06145 [Thermoleophilia bacterium]|nr:hypothetical protein [Thermoleophilia bacterium]
MDEATPLTNSERRDDVAYLAESFAAAARRPTPVLDDEACARYAEADADEQAGLFFTLLCYGALAAQPAPEAVVDADWRRFVDADVVGRVFAGEFDLRDYAVDPPVSRSDSKGKIIDFVRLAETRDTWSRLLPQPAEPEVVVDVLYAASGGALKSRAFWVVREMRRLGLWHDEALDRFAFVPDGRVRKRSARMGLIDLPEKADTFADMKAVSRALHAVMRLNGEGAAGYDLPVSWAAQRCELCDAARMASCPVPHCRWRRSHTAA